MIYDSFVTLFRYKPLKKPIPLIAEYAHDDDEKATINK